MQNMEIPTRKSIRLQEFDYASNGCYHVTVCAKDKQCVFGSIKPTMDGAMVELSEIGKLAEKHIPEIVHHYVGVNIVRHVVMPDHIHMLLYISNYDKSGRLIAAPTLSQVVGQYKRAVSKQAGYSIWQKGFYDHVIRNDDDYIETIAYIENNPLKWLQKSE